MPIIRKFYLILALLATLAAAHLTGQGLVADDNVPGTLIADGYDIELGIGGLNYPSNITHDGEGRIWITEAGFPGVPPTVKAITLADSTGAGMATVVLTPGMLPLGALMPPFTDLTYHDGMIWLGHRAKGANDWTVGAYSRFSPDDPAGTFETVITNLPSTGDHSNNTIVFAPDGRAYFGQGSATNSGVVGSDNADWAAMAPGFTEIAPVDIRFRANQFNALVPTPVDPDADNVTSAYRPFDVSDAGEYTIPAATPDNPMMGIIAGSGTVYSFLPDAPESSLRLEAWGLRNPFGLSFDAADSTRLFISNNGSDVRGRAGDPNDPLDPETYIIEGNRPVAGDYDELFVINTGGEAEFFGWPDFLHDPNTNELISISDPQFCDNPALTNQDCPEPIFAESFRDSLTLAPAFAPVGPFVSVTGIEAAGNGGFGFENDLFATESGSFSPQTGAFTFTGYKIGRYDRLTGEKTDFLVNEGTTAEELLNPATFNKPVAVSFMGDMMLVVDLGALEPGINIFQARTGKVWVVRKRTTTSVDLARDFGARLSAVFPNPASGVANLDVTLDRPLEGQLTIHDISGRAVRTVNQGRFAAGEQRISFPTTDLANGTYVVRLVSGGGVLSRRFVVAN